MIVNYKSDFDFLLTLQQKTEEGIQPVDFPQVDFRGIIYTVSPYSAVTFYRIGDKFKNCSIIDGKLHVICNRHNLTPGKITMELSIKSPNEYYVDSNKTINEPIDTGLELVDSAAGCPDNTQQAINLLAPFINTSAWSQAVKAGYQGTEQEYMDALNNIPELVKQAQMLNAFTAEWAKGKQSIIDALAKWDMAADVSDSFEDLSEKILELPVKGDNQEGVISHAINGAQSWDLLNEINNHQRKDYPYCYAIMLQPSLNICPLIGADAYYTSDGIFYEEDVVDHVFEHNTGADADYVIFYFKAPDYKITLNNNVLKIVVLSGHPNFNLVGGLEFNSIESYSADLYESVVNGTKISHDFVKNIILGGLEIANEGTQISSSPRLIHISMGSLKENKANNLIRSCDAISFLFLPSLEKSSSTIVNSCKAIQIIHLPELKLISGGYVAQSCNVLKDLKLPALSTITGGGVLDNCSDISDLKLQNLSSVAGGTILNACSAISNIELPSLESLSGTIAANCNNLKSIKLPKLKHLFGGPILNKMSGFAGEIDLPSLTELNSSNNIFYDISNAKRISFPILEVACLQSSSGAGLISASIFTSPEPFMIDLPALRQTVNSNGSRADFVLYGASVSTNSYIQINLGSPQDGYIYFTAYSSNGKAATKFTVKSGFRSTLNIASFTNQKKEDLEDIIDNLGDNSEFETLQIVLGAENLAKISDEKKLLATQKNYTLS